MKKIISLMSLLLSTVSFAHDDANSDKNIFREVVVTESISMLQGTGGNVGLLKGEDGLLIIDDDYKVNVGALEKILDKKDGRPRFIINTHWHNDHTGGNEHLGEYVTIIAHDNVRKRLGTAQEIKFFGMKIQASEKPALPVVTFDTSLSLHFNGQELKVVHYPNGHTDGDSIVVIQPANVVHMGDHFFSGRFPFVDVESGGDVIGMITNIKSVIETLDPKVKVIPGHGPLSSLSDLKEYSHMLETTSAIVKEAIDEGMSLKQAQAKGFPGRWKSWGAGFIDEKKWIKMVYTSLKAGEHSS
ncbi:hypothetical protein A9Q81_23570 [Gammaproteobacteria bacterium 42_54_T18]|nr:hypothetical protein A9Q81_23570 [Gammaproteobacteria bacterium 42_54_T18]